MNLGKLFKNSLLVIATAFVLNLIASCSGSKKSKDISKPTPNKFAASANTKTARIIKKEPIRRYRFQGLNIFSQSKYPEMFFKYYGTNPTIDTSVETLSGFSINPSDSSYQLAKNFLLNSAIPNEKSIKVEEFINAIAIKNRVKSKSILAMDSEIFPSPNRKGFHILRLGLHSGSISKARRKPLKLVFVIDTSDTMRLEKKLSISKQHIKKIVGQMSAADKISIVTFNDKAQLALPMTSVRNKKLIINVVNKLKASGNKNIQTGLQLGYRLAKQYSQKKSLTWTILISDGAPVSQIPNPLGLLKIITQNAKQGLRLQIIGIGLNKLNPSLLQSMAQNGSGDLTYMNSKRTNSKRFASRFITKLQLQILDAKMQVNFNRKYVKRFRLLGYESRLIKGKVATTTGKAGGDLAPGNSSYILYELQLNLPRTGKSNSASLARINVYYRRQNLKQRQQLKYSVPLKHLRRRYTHASDQSKMVYIGSVFAEKLRRSYWVRNVSYTRLIKLYNRLPKRIRQKTTMSELGHLIAIAKKLDSRHDKFESTAPLAKMKFLHVPIIR